MSEAYVRTGLSRTNFSIVYHDVFDLYHPYIGDKATLYYLLLLRYRNNESSDNRHGMAWPGRASIVERFQLSYSTLPLIDSILEAAELVTIETAPSGRGRDKIYYIVHDPKDRQSFRYCEEDIVDNLRKLMSDKSGVRGLLGKQKGAKLTQQ